MKQMVHSKDGQAVKKQKSGHEGHKHKSDRQ